MSSTASQRPTQKFRPVLSPTELQHIIALCKKEQPATSTASMRLLAKLAPLLTKIELGIVVPAYTTSPREPRESLLETLTGGEPNNSAIEPNVPNSIDPSSYATKEQYWEACYTKRLSSPTLCSIPEIQAAKEHAYLEGLMTDAEARDFEDSWPVS